MHQNRAAGFSSASFSAGRIFANRFFADRLFSHPLLCGPSTNFHHLQRNRENVENLSSPSPKIESNDR